MLANQLKLTYVLFFLIFTMAPSLGELRADTVPTCVPEPEAFVLYVYDERDAAFLMDQICETAEGQPVDKVAKSDCRCYDKNMSEIYAGVVKGQGPVAIRAKTLKALPEGIRCREALTICQTACNNYVAANKPPPGCAPLRSPGVSPN